MTDFRLTTTAFKKGEPIPNAYGKAHRNVNPPLRIEGVPRNAKSLALIVDDPDAPSGTFAHWLVWNLPPDAESIPEGWEPPTTVRQGTNDFGNVGYDGPKPPTEHTYRFTLYALDTTLDLSNGASRQGLVGAMDGHVASKTRLTGPFAP